MKLEAKVKSTTLTFINRDFFESVVGKYNFRQLKPRYPIHLYLYDRGEKYYISTPFSTTRPKMKMPMFHDSDLDIIQNAKMSQALKDLLQECNDFIDAHWDWELSKVRDAIREIVDGKTMAEAEEAVTAPKYHSVVDYLRDVVLPLKPKNGTKGIYRTTMNRITAYLSDNDVTPNIEEIDAVWLRQYEAWLRDKDLAASSIHMEMRNLRHVFNIAEEQEIITKNPSKKYKMPKVTREMHTVLDAQQMADFRDYPCDPRYEAYRDIAMMSFYLAGINMSDLMCQEKLVDGRMTFQRTKTSNPVDLPVEPETQRLIDKYKGEKHVLEFMDRHETYKSIDKMTNKGLKKIGYMFKTKDKVGKLRKENYLPLFPKLSMYTFRRSFATIASNIGFTDEVIAMCLGHSPQTSSFHAVTEIYIYRNRTHVDKCIRAVIDEVNRHTGRPKEVIDEELKRKYGIV